MGLLMCPLAVPPTKDLGRNPTFDTSTLGCALSYLISSTHNTSTESRTNSGVSQRFIICFKGLFSDHKKKTTKTPPSYSLNEFKVLQVKKQKILSSGSTSAPCSSTKNNLKSSSLLRNFMDANQPAILKLKGALIGIQK